MNKPIQPQMIETPNGERLAVLPWADFESLEDALDLAHAQAVSAALARGESEYHTEEELEAYLAAPTPLAFWREKRGISREVLAQKAGISAALLENIEEGLSHPDPALLLRLSRLLNVRMEDLIQEEDDRAPQTP